jgi:hypothetical protein
MNKFDEAARKAAREMTPYIIGSQDEEIFALCIIENFSDLRSTYDKLVELARVCDNLELSDWPEEWMRLKQRKNELLDDPLVVEAMKGEK